MAKQALGFITPPSLAVALNATTPDPGGAAAAGCVIWSTTTSSLLRWSGAAWTEVIVGKADLTGAAFTGAISTTTSLNTPVIILSGAGINFPAIQVPSTNVNTLDDYEEGTWTPDLRFGGLAVGITYGTRTADYVKVGKKVTLTYDFTLTAKGTSTGVLTVAGIPFAAAAGRFAAVVAGVPSGGATITNLAVSFLNGAVLDFRRQDATVMTALTDVNTTATFRMIGTATYFV